MINALLFLLVFVYAQNGISGKLIGCSDLFNPHLSYGGSSLLHQTNSQTVDVIVYLEHLMNQGHLKIDELERLNAQLGDNKIQSPFLPSTFSTSSTKRVVSDFLIDLLRQPEVELNGVHSWVAQVLARMRAETSEKRQVSTNTRMAAHLMKFFPVQSGSFYLPDKQKPRKVTLTYAFEVMSTLVTQYHWVDIMGDNPSGLSQKNIADLTEYRKNSWELDSPKTNITWWSAIVFANELSKRHNLQPVYNLSGILFADVNDFAGKAGFFLADDKNDWERIVEIAAKGNLMLGKPLHRPPWGREILQADGYRLITHAEYNYLLSLAGLFQNSREWVDYKQELCRFGWTALNCNHSINPVASLEPSIIFNNPFYDIFGNVKIWLQDIGFDVWKQELVNTLMVGSHQNINESKWVTLPSVFSLEYAAPPGKFSTAAESESQIDLGLRLVRTVRFPGDFLDEDKSQ